ncbi:hypothetical protein M513_07534 [Trichuris suis]|uniref:Uncharacterized protein n=1 Tax=Trichuris suis TaxID=68888 RepID=A0A085M359_9BILA|nr:hypothetical protein M513_07534 [Trichuris suis]
MTFLWAQLESDWIRLLFNITKRRILGSILKLQVVVSLGKRLCEPNKANKLLKIALGFTVSALDMPIYGGSNRN